MTAPALVIAVVAIVTALVSLLLSLALARRLRELRAALLAGGTLRSSAPGRLPDEIWVPDAGAPVPADLDMTTTDGTRLTAADFAGADVLVTFLMSSCTSCRGSLPALREACAALPPTAHRPVAVLSGAPDDWPEYRRELDDVVRVVLDTGQRKGGFAWQFGVRSYPAVLVVGGGVVRSAGKTAADVALTPAS